MASINDLLERMKQRSKDAKDRIQETDPGPLPEPPLDDFIEDLDDYIDKGNDVLNDSAVPTPVPTLTLPSGLTLWELVEYCIDDVEAALVTSDMNVVAQHVTRGLQAAADAKDIANNGP